MGMFSPPAHHRTPTFDAIRRCVGALNFAFIDMRQRDFDELRVGKDHSGVKPVVHDLVKALTDSFNRVGNTSLAGTKKLERPMQH